MSTIRKRGRSWQADFVSNGTRVRRSFRTRDAALDALLAATDAPQTRRGHVTVGQLFAEYVSLREAGVATSARGPVGPVTIENDREVLAALVRTKLADVEAARLTDRDLADHHRARGRVSRFTLARDLRVLKSVLRWAVASGQLERVPVRLMGLRAYDRDHVPSVLADADFARLLAAADPQLRLVLALARYAGLRAGEVLALEVTDVSEGAITVRAKVDDDGSRWRPKGRAARRVPIGARLAAELELARAAGVIGERWMFTSFRTGRRIRDVEGRVEAAYRRAALEPQGLHVLRRSWATEAAKKGVSAEILRRAGGWANLEVVQRSYFGLRDEDVAEALRRVG